MPLSRSERRFDRDVLALADDWGAGRCGVAVLDRNGVVAERGSRDVALPWASVTKLATAWTALVAVDRGIVGLDDPAGPPGSTLRHLLAHASGLAFDENSVVSAPARTRIYSNSGYDALGFAVESASGRPFDELLRARVLDPLEMTGARLAGPPSQGLVGTLRDLEALAFELLAPRLVSLRTAAFATTVAFPGLRGVLPGFGIQHENDWGLGPEIAGVKSPHWTGSRNSPRTYGHFGGSGTFLWVDPDAGLAVVALTNRTFGAWAIESWPRFSDAVLAAAS
ncbi:MAG TPA: serine hydrolase domain-containing protein [Candidatus Limnocylindrales bacterium]|nr:serine hydrolase domain-containing protein [Candidatus Limnocylindrales bacterium]